MNRIRVIDSHTGGEPTRVVIQGGPPLQSGTMAEQAAEFRNRYDAYRRAIVNEPRGSDVLVGALLREPAAASCAAGVIFFNNVGYLGMCGHGTIGLIVTLQYLRRIGPGVHRIETPVGIVTARLHPEGPISVTSVPAYRQQAGVRVRLPGGEEVAGDVAWGGNWFFLTENHGQQLTFDRVEPLTDYAWRLRQAIQNQGIAGPEGEEIDHIELFGPSPRPGIRSRSFVLCPGRAYDRSPCGTGTSAKLACLYEDRKLRAGEVWRQESITGSVFEGTIQATGGTLIPTITGRAFITAEATLLLDPDDPCCWGIGA